MKKPVNRDLIPAELKSLNQWVGWRWKKLTGKDGRPSWTKVPYDLKTGRNGDSSDRETWSDYAATEGHDLIGFVFSEDDPYCGVDLDTCVNPESGEVIPLAQQIVDGLDSYAEISPTGTGIKVIVKAVKKGPRSRYPEMEWGDEVAISDRGRFFTLTGWRISDSETIEERQNEIDELYGWLFANPDRETPNGNGVAAHTPNRELTDQDIISHAYRARNSDKFVRLWSGDWETDGYGSQSEADLALCSLLAFWAGPDASRIEDLFGQSELSRGKWTDRQGYRQRTIEKALSEMTEFYTPNTSFGPEITVGTGKLNTVTGGTTSDTAPPNQSNASSSAWPVLHEDAFHGLAGSIVREIEPYTEADPAAVLMNLLSGFGSMVGRGTWVQVGKTRHHAKLNAVLMGESSKARKGMSWDCVKDLLDSVEPSYVASRVASGLSSGEGIINAVRDPEYGEDKNGDPITLDPGVKDKRLLVMEGEFANVLKQTQREGNTLSIAVRNLWDDTVVQTLTKNPMRASDSHVSILGHITLIELQKLLSDSDASNGFANRFLWLCVRRSKSLPYGGDWSRVDTEKLEERLSAAWMFARKAGKIAWGYSSDGLWREEYDRLAEGQPGIFGAMTSRSEAQVVRLALVYTLLDRSKSIELDYLKAALAVWRYCEESVRYVFGDATGDPVADQIEETLKGTPKGLTKNDIRDLFSRHQSAETIGRSLDLLLRMNRVYSEKEPTKGRPVERYFSCKL